MITSSTENGESGSELHPRTTIVVQLKNGGFDGGSAAWQDEFALPINAA
jgi:hypothetical protein